MSKKIIRLTESDINKIVKESLNKVITESNALGKVQKFEKMALESLKNIAQSLGLEMQDMGIYPNNGESNYYEFWDATDETVMLGVKFEHY